MHIQEALLIDGEPSKLAQQDAKQVQDVLAVPLHLHVQSEPGGLHGPCQPRDARSIRGHAQRVAERGGQQLVEHAVLHGAHRGAVVQAQCHGGARLAKEQILGKPQAQLVVVVHHHRGVGVGGEGGGRRQRVHQHLQLVGHKGVGGGQVQRGGRRNGLLPRVQLRAGDGLLAVGHVVVGQDLVHATLRKCLADLQQHHACGAELRQQRPDRVRVPLHVQVRVRQHIRGWEALRVGWGE